MYCVAIVDRTFYRRQTSADAIGAIAPTSRPAMTGPRKYLPPLKVHAYLPFSERQNLFVFVQSSFKDKLNIE